MIPLCSSVMLELVLAVHSYHMTAYPGERGRFVISNTDTSQGPGKHWVTFYFPKRGPYEFFDSLGNRPEDYGVGFEKILNKKYLMSFGQLQQATSNVCGLYCPTTS